MTSNLEPWTPPGPDAIETLNARLREADPGDILAWAAAAVPRNRLVMSTAFGVGGIVLIDHVERRGTERSECGLHRL